MSSLRRKFAPRRALRMAAGAVGVFGSGLWALAPASAQAKSPRYEDTLPLKLVKPGMVGYGLTTFHGNTISRFEVKVIGIIKQANNGRDLILIRMKGGPITERGANLIHGMSGSPIFLNGKIAGAFSQGEDFPKEPIGMVTPIEDMLEAWDPKLPQRPSYFEPAEKTGEIKSKREDEAKPKSDATSHFTPKAPIALTGLVGDGTERTVALEVPIRVGERTIRNVVLNARPNTVLRSGSKTAVLHRATSLLSVSGMTTTGRTWLQKELDKRGYALTVMQGGVTMGKGSPAPKTAAGLKPGSAFGTFLATGDFQYGGFGTVTYRRGNRILGFGHPLMGLGALNAAVTTSYIVDIFSGFQTSHQIAIAGNTIGALTQDRDFSVSADLNKSPIMIPCEITVNDRTTGRTKVFRSRMFQHPDLTPLLLRAAAVSAVGQVHNTPGDVMARITTSVDAAEVGHITRSNTVFDAEDIGSATTQDLSDITSIVSSNPFYPLPIKSAKMTVDLMPGHNTATVERIYLKQGRYEPGDTLDVGVVLKPYRREALTRSISLKLPSDLPAGRYQLLVRGGAPSFQRIGPFVISGGNSDPQTPPVNVRQMVARLNTHEANTDMVARLVLNTVAPAIEGEKLSQLPPNLSALMRSDRNSGVRLERDELRTTQPTEYVVSGTQQLIVNVIRRNTQEPATQGTSPFSSSGGGIPVGAPGSVPSFPGSGSSTGASTSDDETPAGNGEAKPLLAPSGWEKNAGALRSFSSPQTDATQPLDAPEETPAPAVVTEPTKPGRKQARPPRSKSGSKKGTTATPPGAAATTPPAATAPTTPDTSNDKPVARQLQVWRQTAKNDFATGKFAGTGVAATGDLRLTPTLRRLASSNETYIWSLVSDPAGNLYAGTGTGGKILKTDIAGKTTVLAALPIISVQTMLLAKDGSLFAGSGVKGQVYHVLPDGRFRLVTALKEKYILSLAQDSAGNLYIGPGGGGNIYKLDASQLAQVAAAPHSSGTGRIDDVVPIIKEPAVFLKTSSDHIMSLAIDKSDVVYAGTGNDGIVYRVTPDGKSTVVYDAKENAITALAFDGNGTLYAATGPKGLLYRINLDGTANVVYDRTARFFTSLKTAPDGTLYASTVDSVYHILPAADPTQTVVLPLDNPREVDFLSLAVLPDGTAASGTGNIGEIYVSSPDPTAGTARQGTYTSVVHDSRLTSRWGTLRWSATLPTGAHLRAETRTGNVAEPDASWSDWETINPTSSAGEGAVASPPARFIQYRLTLNTDRSTGIDPSLRDVSLDYLPRNQAPRIAFASPAGGERWSKTQTVRWIGSDPDNDTLTYTLLLSSDAGATWKPLPGAAKTAPATGGAATTTTTSTTLATTPAGSATSTTTTVTTGTANGNAMTIPAVPTQSVAEYEKSLPAMPPVLKQTMVEAYRQRLAAVTAEGAGATRETSKALDTTTLPDGVYQLKVVATDRVSNPLDAQTAQAVSEPFLISNTPPALLVLTPRVGSDRTVTLEGSATQPLMAVTAVQYRVDGGEWTAAVPKSGLFDSARADFLVVTSPLLAGKHTVEVEAFNAAGNKTTQKTIVTVP